MNAHACTFNSLGLKCAARDTVEFSRLIRPQFATLSRRERENTLRVKISFDDELAVASILLVDWAPALIEYLGRYFDVSDDMLRLDYAHLPNERRIDPHDWMSEMFTARQCFEQRLKVVAQEGPIALALTLLWRESSDIKDSSSILNKVTYMSAAEDFRANVLQGNLRGLRDAILANISPSAAWVSWLLYADRDRFLNDQEIMAALVSSTPESDCIKGLELVVPRQGQNNWAFEQLVQQHKEHIDQYIAAQVGMARVPDLVLSLFEHSPTVSTSRSAREQVLARANPKDVSELIQYFSWIEVSDVRSLFLRWHLCPKTDDKDDFKKCVAKAYSKLATLLVGTMPSDLAIAAAWHEFREPALSAPQNVAAHLRELPSWRWSQETLWSQLGPAAHEAWRQDLFDLVKGDLELAQGLIYFACLWLEQTAFTEVEPVLLRLLDHEEHFAFANQFASEGPRQMQLRAKGLVRTIQRALDLVGEIGGLDDITALPSVGAQTWLGDPSVERVIHSAISQVEEQFCLKYSETWGEDEDTHTARLLASTEFAVAEASRKLRQLSATTRSTYPSLSVNVRQPNKREEGACTPAGAPLGADILFVTRILDKGKTIIERATLVQVKKRYGTASGRGFSSTIGVDLQQCEDLLTQSEHAYYLFATMASRRPTLWIAPARLVRNLAVLNSSNTSVDAIQVRDASCSYADFFLYYLVGLWAGDEDRTVITIANGNPRLGRTLRHIVEIEVHRQSEVSDR